MYIVVLFWVMILWMKWVFLVVLWFFSSVFGLICLIILMFVDIVLCRFRVMWCGLISSVVLVGRVVRVVVVWL